MVGARGDGSAIDRTAWNVVFALGRPVRIIGEHRLDNDVSLPNGAVMMAEPGKGILTAGTSGTVLVFNVKSDVTIRGVWFKGRMDGPALAGIAQFANCRNLRIDGRCRFYDHKYAALTIINGISCAVDNIEVYRCGFHDNVDSVAPAVAFFQLLIGTGLSSAAEMELWPFNGQNSFTNNHIEEAYGCKVAGQFGFTGDHNRMYGRGLVAPGFGLSHNSHLSFCHNNISSGKYGGAGIDSLVSYRCKYNDNVFWECAGAGLLIDNSTDDKACNNFCHDTWQSYNVDPIQYPGNGCRLSSK